MSKGQIKEQTQSEQQRKEMGEKTGGTFGNLWDSDEKSNILIIGIPEGEERESRSERIFKKMIALQLPLYISGKELV